MRVIAALTLDVGESIRAKYLPPTASYRYILDSSVVTNLKRE